jgi:glutathione S-transferase
MKLYSGDLSPYSAKVRMQIYAKGITDIPLERPTAFPTLAWRETSPIGRIPVLELAPGDVIPESEVISEYLEETYPTPRLLGATPRESATIRALSRLADIYLLNNMFMLSGQTRASTRSEAVRDLLGGQVIRGVEALEKMIDGEGGYALLGRITLADCTLVPALFLIENVLPATDTPDPIPANPKVAAYWRAIQQDPSAAKVMVELHRGLQERRELIRRMAEKERAGAAS